MKVQIQSKPGIDPRTREGLARILDLLLPGTRTLPSGREIGAHEEFLDRVLDASPRLAAPVRRIGDVAAEHESCNLADLQQWAGDELESVVFALQAAYYMAPRVMQAHHYPGQTRRPIAQATPDEVCSENLLAPVVRRGPIYVPTPPHSGDQS